MNILFWVLIWMIGMGTYYIFFRPRNILYKNSPVVITGWYLLWFAMVITILFLTKKELTTALYPNGFLAISLGGMFLFWLGLGRRHRNKESRVNLFIAKLAEIFFQQSMILWLVGLVSLYGFGHSYQVVVFSLIFLLAHLPIYLFFPFKKASTYVIPSILSGIVFMLPVLFLPGGIYLSIGVHLLFYAFLAYKGTVWGSEEHFSHF